MDFGYMLSVSLRSLVLGSIVFASVSGIPQQDVGFQAKIAISVVVVVVYALIDYVRKAMLYIRGGLCRLLCGCIPGNGLSSNQLGDLGVLGDLGDLNLDDFNLDEFSE